ncbi:MAG TPA: xanthine dehydrogenase family protein subunit M [Pyrinomonadaceae bacterium]|jgi:xanthine dehydrogenase YagS FAD-binding subunit|nr:xanthine dehydrogenase family protein subunit M [Pyrinomonadaceae bacterium]
MQPFKYTRATDPAVATRAVASTDKAKFIAGGTNILDLMKEGVEKPSELVDVTRLNLAQIRATQNGISIGALAKNTDTANHPLVRQGYPLLAQAILAGASAQIRNMATNGGNLVQRTRCSYFYDVSMPCNKREPGSGCGALEGINRNHAIFGWSEKCIAVHPSDMCVALAALDAVVNVQDAGGKQRSIPFADFHRLPGDAPEQDNNLRHGELITSIEIPKSNFADASYYLKVRDRASYAFALVSVAAALELAGGKIKQARVAMGGVAHKPWRAGEAEKLLVGKTATEANFAAAADAEMKAAKPFEHNKFKVELGRRAIVLALKRASHTTGA